MSEILEAQFEQIMVDAIVRAEKLDPDMDLATLYEGMRTMQERLNERVDEARVDAGIEVDHKAFFTF